MTREDVTAAILAAKFAKKLKWADLAAAIGLTLAGAVLGVLVALGTPQRYTAYSEVLIDPREVQLVGRDLERELAPMRSWSTITAAETWMRRAVVTLAR